MREVVIIGSGPAGYTAAIYAARADLKPLLIASSVEPGGELMKTTEVENYPGFPTGTMGPDLMADFQAQAERFGTEIMFDDVTEVDLSGEVKIVKTGGGETIEAKTVIISTGAAYRELGLPKEKELSGHGVSWCATCDGFFYRNKPVAVIGGGNTAVEEALYLANICSHVTLVHRRDSLRAEKILQKKLFEREAEGKVSIQWNHVLEEVLGDDMGVTGARIRHVTSDEPVDLVVDGVFIAIGHVPNSEIFKGQLDMKNGYVVVNTGLDGMATQTSVPGVFAAGDIADQIYRQAVTSAGFGCMAALDAEKFLDD